MKKIKKAFNVEIEGKGCKECGQGTIWIVVGPDGAGGGTSYESREDAEDIASDLNTAYELGQRNGR